MIHQTILLPLAIVFLFLVGFFVSNISISYHYYTHAVICDDPSYALLCENNRTVLYLNYGRHLVQAIYDTNSTPRVITGGVDNNNCSTITRHSVTYNNFSDAFKAKEDELAMYDYSVGALVFISCENPLLHLPYTGIVAPCTSGKPKTHYSYVLTSPYLSVSDVAESCNIDWMVKMVPWGPMTCNENCSYPRVQSEEVKGIEIKWRADRCGEWKGGEPNCWFDNATNMVLSPYRVVARLPLFEVLYGEHS